MQTQTQTHYYTVTVMDIGSLVFISVAIYPEVLYLNSALKNVIRLGYQARHRAVDSFLNLGVLITAPAGA